MFFFRWSFLRHYAVLNLNNNVWYINVAIVVNGIILFGKIEAEAPAQNLNGNVYPTNHYKSNVYDDKNAVGS